MPDRATLASNFFNNVAGSRGGLEFTEAPPPDFEHLQLPGDERKVARHAYRKVVAGETLDRAEQFALEAIIIPDRRPAIDITRGAPVRTGLFDRLNVIVRTQGGNDGRRRSSLEKTRVRSRHGGVSGRGVVDRL